MLTAKFIIFVIALIIIGLLLNRCTVLALTKKDESKTLTFRHHKIFLYTSLALVFATPIAILIGIFIHLIGKDELLLALAIAPVVMFFGLFMLAEYFRFYMKLTPSGIERRSLNTASMLWNEVKAVEANINPFFGHSSYWISSRVGNRKFFFAGDSHATAAFIHKCRQHLPLDCAPALPEEIERLS